MKLSDFVKYCPTCGQGNGHLTPGVTLYGYYYDFMSNNRVTCKIFEVIYKKVVDNKILVTGACHNDYYKSPELLFPTVEEAWDGLKNALREERDTRIRDVTRTVQTVLDGNPPTPHIA
jgi:hypothetical protein